MTNRTTLFRRWSISRDALFRRWSRSSSDRQTITKPLKEPDQKLNTESLAEETISVPLGWWSNGIVLQKHRPCMKRLAEDRISAVSCFWSSFSFQLGHLPCVESIQSEPKLMNVEKSVKEAIQSILVRNTIDIDACQKDYIEFVEQLREKDRNFTIPHIRVGNEVLSDTLYHIKLYFETDLLLFFGAGCCLEDVSVDEISNENSLFVERVKINGCAAMERYLNMRSEVENHAEKFNLIEFTDLVLINYLTNVVRTRLLFDEDGECKKCCFYRAVTKKFLDTILGYDYHNVINS